MRRGTDDFAYEPHGGLPTGHVVLHLPRVWFRCGVASSVGHTVQRAEHAGLASGHRTIAADERPSSDGKACEDKTKSTKSTR